MKEAKDYSPSKDARLINCKTECGNERCFAKRYGLFAEKTCHNFVEPKLITNYDRIRAMSVEEMAEFLGSIVHDYGQGTAEIEGEGYVICDWLDWLKQEVSTNG